MIRILDVAIGAALAVIVTLGAAKAGDVSPRLYADSVLVTRDRFSDEITGAGPDLIFIPGLASSRATWAATAGRLKAHYRIHLIQVAGFAGEPLRGNASGEVLAPTAEAIDAYMVEQHLTPATVIGHSLGGTMALYLAEHHGDHLRKVLLVDALPFYSVLVAGPNATVDGVRPMAERLRASTQPAPNMDQTIARMVSSPANRTMVGTWAAATDQGAANRAMADDLELDLRPGLAATQTPITLLYPDYVPAGAPRGIVDSMYMPAYAAVPHRTLARIDNSLHFIMLDQPAAFDAALDAFLKS